MKMTAGTWRVHNDTVAVQAIITANATTATSIALCPIFKDEVMIVIYAKN